VETKKFLKPTISKKCRIISKAKLSEMIYLHFFTREFSVLPSPVKDADRLI
jgi:hypothetical protein